MHDERLIHVKVVEIEGKKRFVTVLAPVAPNEKDRFWQTLRNNHRFNVAPHWENYPNHFVEYALTKADQSM